MKNVVGERGQQHGIRPAENSDNGEEGENSEDPAVRRNVAEAFERLSNGTAAAGDLRLFFRQPHQKQSGDDGDEADAVTKKTERDAEMRHEKPGDGRADDAGAVGCRAVERDRVHQILAAGHLDDERLARGHVERHRDSTADSERDDVPRLNDFYPNQRGHGERDEHRTKLGDDDD